jgi:hypothetical protein
LKRCQDRHLMDCQASGAALGVHLARIAQEIQQIL